MNGHKKTHDCSCACGQVKFEIHGDLGPLTACHCQYCRKSSGHHFVSTNVPQASLVFISDASLKWYQSSKIADRGFCSNCGSQLFYRPKNFNRMAVLAGCFDGDLNMDIEEHIFVEFKGDYYKIEDDKPQYATAGPHSTAAKTI